MNEQLKKQIAKFKEFWGKLSKKAKTIIFSVIGGILAISLVAAILLNLPKYTILYPSLDSTEAQEVCALLKERDIPYKEEKGTIKVPAEKENSVRMDLSNEGYPKTSPNYQFFLDNVNVMTTDQEKKVIEKYQLNQRLESVVKSIDGIRNATVTINVPDDSGYILSDNKKKTTAGVSVSMDQGKSLSAKQVEGIKHLLSKSVPDLADEDVAVIDTATGYDLSSTTDSGTQQIDLAKLKLEVEKKYEDDLSQKISDILVPVFGKENVHVAAKSVIDINKKVQEITTYNPSQDNKGVISEEKKDSEKVTNSSDGGGTTGTDTNTEIPNYPGVTVDKDSIYIKNNEDYKYLVSQIKEQVQKDAGEIKDVTVSVAINRQFMDDVQKDDVAKLIGNSAGVDSSKVMVYNDLFEKTTQPNEDKQTTVGNIFQNRLFLILFLSCVAGLILVIIIICIIAARRKKKLKALLAQAEEEANQAELNPEGSEEPEFDVPEIGEARETKEQALKNEISDFSSQHPEIAAQLIRTWLKGDD